MTKMTAPEAFLIKLSTQQHHDFTECARVCGLDLAAWIVQCADVQAAAAIDAMQAMQRVQRPDRKKQRPRMQVEHKEDVNSIAESPGAEDPTAKRRVQNSTEFPTNSTALPTNGDLAAKNLVKGSAQHQGTRNATIPSTTLKAARAYNESFRRRGDEPHKGQGPRDEDVL